MPLLRRAVRRVRRSAAAKGKTVTRAQAVKTAKMRIKRDRDSTAGTRFDWAKDGLGTKDKSFGSDANNAWREKRGKKRANVAGASKFGTGRRFKKKKTNGGGSSSGGGASSGGGSDAGYGGS